MAVKIELSKNRDKDKLALTEPLSRAGLYTIAEAVEVIKREADVNIHDHLIEAVHSATLPTYEPNSTKRYIYGKDKRIRDFYEEIYWEDLNNWLEVNERLISYRFPDPNGEVSAKAARYDNNKIWLEVNPNDPIAVQPWYTPARYFARKLVEDDSTLLHKRKLLAEKTSKSLKDVGIFKRGGKLPIAGATVLKAFTNITFT